MAASRSASQTEAHNAKGRIAAPLAQASSSNPRLGGLKAAKPGKFFRAESKTLLHGSAPEGSPTVLEGMVWVCTGTLAGMSRATASQCIEKHGGKVVKSVTKKLTHALVGEGFGPRKMAKFKAQGVTLVTEDEFHELVTGKARAGASDIAKILGRISQQ